MGPIRVGPNGRYFVDAEGRPFFWLGDTLWELFRCHPREDAAEILARRKAQGFTVLQIMMTGVGDGSAASWEDERPWHDDDPTAPNEAYFRRADAIIEIAGRRGLVLAVGIFHQLQRNRLTVANARSYARWLARRYASAPHLVWSMYPEAKPEYIPVLRELAAGLREGDPLRRLITVHPDPSPTSSGFLNDEPWLDFHSIQTCVTYERIPAMVAEDYARTPARPVVMAEGGYEGLQFGKRQTPREIRKQAYWTHLAGGHHTYGHNGCWEAPENWRSWIDTEGAAQLGAYRKILTALPAWWEGVPAPALLPNDISEGMAKNLAMRAARGEWALVYLGSDAPATIAMESAVAGETAEVAWLDPITGETTAIGRLPCAGRQSFAPPAGWEDALLRITPPATLPL